ncbi:response regulator transcription factor [Streptomyces sp. NPDC001941]|uniref:response regulator transcription factor n=1 Tax=Streptomyces sp. NPDC001941 TaxID=3154659 RepID=UPI0033316194
MRVVLAEDLFLLRDGLVRLLRAYGFEILAAVESGPELARALAELEPDVAVVDVRLPPSHTDEGLQCALAARRARPGLPVLVLSQHVEQLYARELLADGNGGVGYLLKDRVFDADQFVDAVRRVAGGGTAMDPQVVQQLLTRKAGRGPLGGPGGALTPRELEVMELVAQGRSNTAIAERLVVTERAVAKHTSNIFAKLGLEVSDDDNRRVLAVLAHLDRG